MTESQWLVSTDPQEMLRAIDPTLTKRWKRGEPEPWRAWSERKGRLLAYAWRSSAGMDPSNQDENEDPHTVKIAHGNVLNWVKMLVTLSSVPANTQADLLRDIFGNPWQPFVETYGRGFVYAHNQLKPSNPWLIWRDGLIPHMAQDIYDNRRFNDLPILADALEEAGCVPDTKCSECNGSEADNMGVKWCKTCRGTGMVNDLLVHLRAPCPYCQDAPFDTGDAGTPLGKGLSTKALQEEYRRKFAAYHNKRCVCKGTRLAVHVRGCWVLDLLLGKE